MDSLGPRSLTQPETQLHLCVWWECTDVAGEPFIQRSPGSAGGRAGIGVGGEAMHSPGTGTHYMHDGCETPLRTLSLHLAHIHTRRSPRINQTFSDDGRPSVAVCGWGLFGRWSQKSNGIVFMQEIKKPPLCTVMEMRGLEGERWRVNK